MKIVKRYKDEFQNMAIIDTGKTAPYAGAPKTETFFRVSISSIYDNFTYHVATFDTLHGAINHVKNFGTRTFKECEC